MSGGGIGKIISAPINAVSGLLGGKKDAVKVVNQTAPAQDTAQKEVDKKQQSTNAALARKKNRSLLSTGAISTDYGTANQAQSKKLLGE